MSTQDENKNKSKKPLIIPDTEIEEGLENINSASGNSPDNVISNTHKRMEDEKHGRKHGQPITGTSPRGVE